MRRSLITRMPWIAPLVVIVIAVGLVVVRESTRGPSPAIKSAQPASFDPFLLTVTDDATTEPWILPSSNAGRWDFGGGANTAQNWSSWKGAATR